MLQTSLGEPPYAWLLTMAIAERSVGFVRKWTEMVEIEQTEPFLKKCLHYPSRKRSWSG